MNQKKIMCCLFVFVLAVSMLLVTGEIKAQQQVSSVDRDIVNLEKIHVKLTDGNQRQEGMIRRWMINPHAGFPDLVKVLLEVVKCPEGGCNVRGPFLPLDVIEGICRENRGNPGKVIMDHKPKEVIEAYIAAWYEKNPNEDRDLTLGQILRGD